MTASSQPLTIRPATADDAAPLAELAERTFVDAFGADNTPDDLAAFVAATYGPDLQRRELQDDALHHLVAEQAGAMVAFALLRAKASPHVADPSAIELQRFYVDRRHHGTGIARVLLDACLQAALARGARTLWLGVWERNPRAIRFYEAQGFTAVGAQVFTVGSDPQRDIVMARTLDRAR